MPALEDKIKVVPEQASNCFGESKTEDNHVSITSSTGEIHQMTHDVHPGHSRSTLTSQPAHQRLVFADPVAFRYFGLCLGCKTLEHADAKQVS